MKSKYVQGLGECYVLPTLFIDKIFEVMIRGMEDFRTNLLYVEGIAPLSMKIFKRGFIIKDGKQYCTITKKEFIWLNKKFEESQAKARMVF